MTTKQRNQAALAKYGMTYSEYVAEYTDDLYQRGYISGYETIEDLMIEGLAEDETEARMIKKYAKHYRR